MEKTIQTDYDNFHKKTAAQKKFISDNNFTYRIILKTINTYLNESKKQRILDIGCGAGTLCLYYGKKGNKVSGIDISKKAVQNATESAKILHLKNVTFKQMNFPKEIPKDTYDFIIFTEVIEHLEDDQLALKKIYSLLKPNGIAVISTPSQNAPLHKLGLAKKFDKEVGHLRRYTLEDLKSKCKKCGFAIIGERKTEGVVRNFLFLNPVAGKFLRLVKFFVSDIVTGIDAISLKMFGESNVFVIVQKPK
jgi:SAM-dependent methyltransferase